MLIKICMNVFCINVPVDRLLGEAPPIKSGMKLGDAL
jgi:hypothetical protein